ncbi:MAG: hypothetical protein QOG25_2689 [Acetobacteraceae bacterium]|jgi:choline dehydrogenase-like flavoprotein|nr:hypothetical protein [Acetobacteraceae bacterium]
MKQCSLKDDAWGGMSPRDLFRQGLLHDIVVAYWSYPTAWNEIGWGGPASPRGYVRMGYDERDPWEAAEAHDDADKRLCVTGCSTNAKQSAPVTWIPHAVAAGAEIRDLAMAGRIEVDAAGRATGVHYREGEWHFQRARNVVVAGYTIETPRLLLNSATDRYPDGFCARRIHLVRQ